MPGMESSVPGFYLLTRASPQMEWRSPRLACDELARFGRFSPASEGVIPFSVAILSDQIAELFGRARRYYASARVCEDADLKRRLVLMADDYVRKAKGMQGKQERLVENSK
jgi:hypothetical protein